MATAAPGASADRALALQNRTTLVLRCLLFALLVGLAGGVSFAIFYILMCVWGLLARHCSSSHLPAAAPRLHRAAPPGVGRLRAGRGGRGGHLAALAATHVCGSD